MSTEPRLPDVHTWTEGSLRGVTFGFPDVGSVLPLHSHPEGQAHFTFVRKGRIKILRAPGVEERVVGPGTWLKFLPGELHGYEALEAGSKITNVTY